MSDGVEGSSLEWASKLLGVKPDQLEEALVAKGINPGGFGSADFVVVPSSPTVRMYGCVQALMGVCRHWCVLAGVCAGMGVCMRRCVRWICVLLLWVCVWVYRLIVG